VLRTLLATAALSLLPVAGFAGEAAPAVAAQTASTAEGKAAAPAKAKGRKKKGAPVVQAAVAAPPPPAFKPTRTKHAVRPSPALEALQAYAALQHDVTELKRLPLKTAADVDTALKLVVRHDPAKVAAGFFVYIGVVGAQEPAFAQESYSLVSAYGREMLLTQLPLSNFGGNLRSANEAMSLALNTADADAARIRDTASAYHQLAIALQKQPWAKKPLTAKYNAARLATVRAAAGGAPAEEAAPLMARFESADVGLNPLQQPTAFGGRRFWDNTGAGPEVTLASLAAPSPQAVSEEPAYVTTMKKALTFSILYALEAEGENPQGLSKLLNDGSHHTAECISLRRMSFFNALSIARDQTETVAAVRDHLDTYAECFGKVLAKRAP
jgi:hypothetical protein